MLVDAWARGYWEDMDKKLQCLGAYNGIMIGNGMEGTFIICRVEIIPMMPCCKLLFFGGGLTLEFSFSN